MSNINNAMGAVASFIAANPSISPDRIEFTIQSLLRFLKKKGKPVTKENLQDAFDTICESIESLQEPEAKKPEAKPSAKESDVESYRQQINSWSADEMRSYCKDPEVLHAVEAVLNTPRPEKETPKPAVKAAKATKPQLTAEELAVEKMTSDQMKKALLDPVKARGIERILAAVAAKRRNGQ